MKKFYLVSILSLSLGFMACSDDDDSSSNDDMMEEGDMTGEEMAEEGEIGTCVTCTLSNLPVELCEGENGNAFLSGVDLMVDFEAAILSRELAGATCQ